MRREVTADSIKLMQSCLDVYVSDFEVFAVVVVAKVGDWQEVELLQLLHIYITVVK